MKRFIGRRALALAAVPLALALLGAALWASAPRAAASAAPTVTVSGYPGPGDDLVIGGGNWPYGDSITITYDGTQIATAVARLHSSVAGPIVTAAFLVGIQIPDNTTMGAHTITATDPLTGDTAQQVITVTAEWKQFGFTSANTRYNPYEATIGVSNVKNLTLDWLYNSGEFAPFPIDPMNPSAANGNVFVAVNGLVLELNSATGKQIWANGTNYWTYGAPAIAYGSVYATTGYFVSYDAATGAIKWESDPKWPNQINSPVVADGMVYSNEYYSASTGSILDAFDAAGCGQLICAPVWRYSPPGSGTVSGTPSVTNGSVYTTNFNAPGGSGLAYGSHVIAVDAKTGALQWYGQLGDYEEAFSTSEDNGYLIVSADAEYGTAGYPGGTLYVFNAAGCGQVTCAPLWTSYSAEGFGRAAAVANGVIYIGGQDGALNAFNEAGCLQATCSPLWQSAPSAKAPTWRTPTPAVANGVVYFPNWSPGGIQAFDAAGCPQSPCSPLWSYTINLASTASGSPIIVNGTLYQSDDTGVLYAFHLPAAVAKSGATQTSPTITAASQRSPGQPSRSPSRSPRYQAIWAARLSRYQEGWALGQSLL